MRTLLHRLLILLLSLPALATLPALAEERERGRENTLFQVSTLDSLIGGAYSGRVRFRTLERRGDFGLGTFHRLDGEMVALDGEYYRVRTDGRVSPVEPCETTPFAAVTPFESERSFNLADAGTCAELQEAIEDHSLPSDVPLAIRVTGRFPKLETRSVPAQSEPYPPLATVIADQTVFDLYDVRATLVGFWFPETFAGVNAAGFHFHAITHDKRAGGHVLDCQPGRVRVDVDPAPKLVLNLADGRADSPPGRRCSR
jgi:acetolactate decarboxylase